MQTKKIIKIIAIVFAAVILSVAALGVCYYFYLESKIDSTISGKLPEEVKTQKPELDPQGGKTTVQNILACGIVYQNEIEQNSERGLTDIMLYINLVTEPSGEVKANILQIPRDTYIGAELSPNGRLNAVYANGENQTDLIANLATRIYEDFKLPVDDYVVIDMDACKEIINAMGGVNMYVPWDVYDPKAPDMGVPQGWHKIDGETAEFIIRQRDMYAQKDFKRQELQQYFYKAVFKTIREDFPLTEAPAMAHKVLHYSKTDMNLAELISTCLKVIKLKDENMFIVRMPGGSFTVEIPTLGKQSVYGINAENLAPILNEHFRYGQSPVPASELGILTGFDYPLGETNDPGKTLSGIELPPQE